MFPRFLQCAACAAVVALGLVARADEAKIDLKDVPAAVKATIEKQWPGAELKNATKEEENGNAVYEVAFSAKGRGYSIEATGAGELIEVEESLSAKELPAAVVSAIDAKHKNATIEKADKATQVKKGKSVFEVVIKTAEGTELECVFDADGAFLKEGPADND